MFAKIESDRHRFDQIVQGKIRENLHKYISHGEMIGRQDGDLISIPIPHLEVPDFRYGDNGSGGVGQGNGEIGQPISKGNGEKEGQGTAGSHPGGGHFLEVEISLEKLAEILGEELEFPRIEPKGQAKICQQRTKYNSIRRTGPESFRHFKRTYMRALRRQISTGTYQPEEPFIVPIREDKNYRSWTLSEEPEMNAVVIYLMDVSGSMTEDQKKIVRTEAFWIDTWLRHQYSTIEKRYIIHDAAAKEVDEHTFYHTYESGGTRISAAYKVCCSLFEHSFTPAEWNIYCFQFSDGDNWGEDNDESLTLLQEQILPYVNFFCYGQVESPYGSGEYLHALRATFDNQLDTLVLSEIPNKEAVFESIKAFLGKRK